MLRARHQHLDALALTHRALHSAFRQATNTPACGYQDTAGRAGLLVQGPVRRGGGGGVSLETEVLRARRASGGSQGNDGVVEYKSAHIEGIESEMGVHAGHSTQAILKIIEEVRRILYEHAAIH
jgi:hypothetical protein